MKKYLSLLNVCLCTVLLLSTYQSKANNDDPKIEKKKTYAKSYSISSSDKISIDNQFGEVIIKSGNQSEVKVDVIIIAKSSTDERAQAILDRISIEDSKSSGGVSFKTKMKNENKSGKNKNYKEEKMEINYTVSMPLSNPLVLNNQFGATVVPDMKGTVDITSKFGTLTAGKLDNVKTVTVEFGTAMIESISKGTLTVKFSRAIVNKLQGSVDAVFEHSSGVKLGVENSTRELRVTSAFSTLYVDVNKTLGASYDINTSFGELSNKTDFDIKEGGKNQNKSPNFNHSYSGKSGSGNTSVKIGASFSHITLGHDLTMDLKEDKKKTVI